MFQFGGGDERTAAESALARLRERILTGELEPGTKLNQAFLARDLGMSRIPVRDAIRALAAEGLVTHDPHRTAIVTPLSADDLTELYELRIAIEPHASALALGNVGPEELGAMTDDLRTMGEAEDSNAWLESHDRFHAFLYRHSGRPRMISLLDRARAQTRRYTWIRLDRNAGEMAAEHGLILSAAERGDHRSLETLVRAHLTASFDFVSRRLAELARTEPEGTGRRLTTRGGDVHRATA
ncbi:MAG: GntR family transcriptional regulator [Actinomycetota bacterium]